ncbi:MAG: S8 family serine peptidase [bacterium]
MHQFFRRITKFGLFLAIFWALTIPSGVFAQPITPNDPFFLKQNYLQNIQAPEAWSKTQGRGAVVVAVLDTGVDVTHPDLQSNIWRNLGEVADNGIDDDHNGYVDDIIGWDFVTNTNSPTPKLTDDANPGGMHHGTLVAGIIGAMGNNGIGVAGLNWNVRIMPVRVLDGSGYGVTSKVDDAIRYAVDNGANVINLSFTSDVNAPEIEEAIQYAHNRGVVVVTVAGNDLFHNGLDLDKDPIFPACVGSPQNNIALTVASVDQNDVKTIFSNYGKNCVDLAAPGDGVFGTEVLIPGKEGYAESYGDGWSGTSVSAPMVSGAAALLKAYLPSATAPQIIRALMESADKIDVKNPTYAGKLGSGRLNIKAALDKITTLPPAAASTPSNKTWRYIAGRGAGSPPSVVVLNEQGLMVSYFDAYPSTFLGGVKVAAGDVDGDGQDEIITAPGSGFSPEVKVFEMDGKFVKSIMAYSPLFQGGVNVAVGDVNGDGKAEIITGAGPGGGPHLRVLNQDGGEIGGFMAFDPKFRGGISVAAADLDADGKKEVVVGMNSLGRKLYAFNKDGALFKVLPDQTFALEGMVLTAADLNNDSVDELIVGQRKGGSTFAILNGSGVPAASYKTSTVRYLGGLMLAAQGALSSAPARLLVSLAGNNRVAFYSSQGKLETTLQFFAGSAPAPMSLAVGRVLISN